MRAAGDTVHGQLLRALIVMLWRAGLRISEALRLAESDLDPRCGAVLVCRGKGGRRREVGMDDWAWEQIEPWLAARREMPVGPLLCVITGPTRGRGWSSAAARSELRLTAVAAGVRRRFAPHQLRHAQPSRRRTKESRCLSFNACVALVLCVRSGRVLNDSGVARLSREAGPRLDAARPLTRREST